MRILVSFVVLPLTVAAHVVAAPASKTVTRIAFGSCAHQDFAQPIWETVVSAKPDVFLFLGDNIYADTIDPLMMQDKYDRFVNSTGFKKLKAQCRIVGTWDDHDYGQNDAGEENPIKGEAKKELLRFLDEPDNSPRWERQGVYDARVFGPPGRRVQFILLDTRYFRTALNRVPPDGDAFIRYDPQEDPEATLLGDAQWAWLEAQLRVPADLRILASSIQVLPTEHVYEKWANIPRERARLLSVLRMTKAKGVIILSGDRHFSELSLDKASLAYPLYELTADSPNRTLSDKRITEPNRFRKAVFNASDNFGMVTIDWVNRLFNLEIRNDIGNVVLQQQVDLDDLE